MSKYLIVIFLVSSSVYSFNGEIGALEEGLDFILKPEIGYAQFACSDKTKSINVCSKYISKYKNIRNHYINLWQNPESLGYPSKVRFDGGQTKKYDKDLFSTRSKLERLVLKCERKRKRSCYPSLKNKMTLKDLNKEFNKLKKDSLFRMPFPAVHCYQRAYLLAERLTKQGYETSLLQIGSAPTLIAMTRDSDDNLKKEDPIDYGGIHWVVSVKAIDKKGKTDKFILDPQFSASPMPYKNYFIQTIGQDCKKNDYYFGVKDTSYLRIKKWKCGYKEYPSNHALNIDINRDVNDNMRPSRYIEGEDILLRNNSCGFDFSENFREGILKMVNGVKHNPEIITNGTGLRGKTIIEAYEQQYLSLKAMKKELLKSIVRYKDSKKKNTEEFELSAKSSKKFYKRDQKELGLVNKLIKKYDRIIKKVKKNMSNL